MARNRRNRHVKDLRGLNFPCALCSLWGYNGLSKDLELAALGGLFATNAEWDQKGDVAELTGLAIGTGWVEIADEFNVRTDVFSNLHFGYIFAYAGEPKSETVRLSGGHWNPREQAEGWVNRQLFGNGLPEAGATDRSDNLAVKIGYDLCNCLRLRVRLGRDPSGIHHLGS